MEKANPYCLDQRNETNPLFQIECVQSMIIREDCEKKLDVVERGTRQIKHIIKNEKILRHRYP